ncbi:MAG: Dolichyl-phosphate-mannose-protein mannosyltransferase [Microgenomates bacterium OLB23]|nr:MAG: Dolichyl-phosphate-mannose-protein mannosyltransferase [Microgenomates bacterium OLB23]
MRRQLAHILCSLTQTFALQKKFNTTLLSEFAQDPAIAAVAFAEKSSNGDMLGKSIITFARGLVLHARAGNAQKGITAWANGGSCIFRADYLRRLHAFDTMYSPFYWEDIDLSYRAYSQGFKIIFYPEYIVEHARESTIATYFPTQHVSHIAYRNQFLFTWANITDMSLTISFLLWLPINLLLMSIKGETGFIGGFFSALKYIPSLIKRRSVKLSQQRVSDAQIFCIIFMKKINLFLLVCIVIAIFMNFYKYSQVPGCLNADEAAFGYNAFALLKTMRDEHGAFLPLRLLSFNDLKLPLYSYLSIPFTALFGLNMFSTRLLSNIAGVLLIPVIYLIVKELFNDKKPAYVAAFLAAISPWIYILSRHAHETVLSTLFIALSLLMLVRFLASEKIKHAYYSLLFIFLSSFAYHSARIYLMLIVGFIAAYLLKKNTIRSLGARVSLVVALLIVLAVPFLTDYIYGTNRVNNLVFTSNDGFQLKLDEFLREDFNRVTHNKGTEFIKELSLRYLAQLSPEFLVINGDANPRFGMSWLGLITPIEYLFIFIGMYFVVKNKEPSRYVIFAFFIIAPFANALTWMDGSLTRTYPMIIPLIAFSSYGIVHVYSVLQKSSQAFRFTAVLFALVAFAFFAHSNFDLYFNHYFKRAHHIRSWQCGYKELADYIKETYNDTDKFYITQANGQPYIYLLYFMQYDPARYHNTAQLSEADEYGFTQVKSFDKFSFELPSGPDMPQNAVFIGFPDDFRDRKYNGGKIKKVTYGQEEIFWIYKN